MQSVEKQCGWELLTLPAAASRPLVCVYVSDVTQCIHSGRVAVELVWCCEIWSGQRGVKSCEWPE